MYEVTMPKLSDSMETGKIIEWRVEEGDQVSEGDALAEVESDKAVMDLECFRAGVVAQITHGDGEEVAVGQVIALIGDAGEVAEPAEEAERPVDEEEPEAEEAEPEDAAVDEEAKTVYAPSPPPPARATQAPSRSRVPLPGDRVAISPYARRLAAEKGVDYTGIAGTGPGGRIVASDIEAATAGAPKAALPAPQAPPARVTPDEELPPIEVAEDEADVEDASFRLKTQAKRVMASQHVIPHFYLTRGMDVSRLLERREALKEEFGVTVTHLVMYACIRALKMHPEVNRSYDRGRIVAWKGIHLGLAVDTDQGLTVAVLRDAQNLALPELAEKTAALVEKARAGKLSADERRHPTFTVTNLGMFGVEHFEPIINPPSSITLAVASALPAAVVRDDTLHIGEVMKLTAACDHRIIDGATAGRFMADLRQLLEDPDKLLGAADE